MERMQSQLHSGRKHCNQSSTVEELSTHLSLHLYLSVYVLANYVSIRYLCVNNPAAISATNRRSQAVALAMPGAVIGCQGGCHFQGIQAKSCN